MFDGLIDGTFHPAPVEPCCACDHCGVHDQPTCEIRKIKLPEGIKPGPTLIGYQKYGVSVRGPKWLGLNCGCYAKFHRQIAHIQGRMKK